MTDLHEAVSDYLTIRRALGLKLVEHQRLLPQFASFLEMADADTVTTELAIAWGAAGDFPNFVSRIVRIPASRSTSSRSSASASPIRIPVTARRPRIVVNVAAHHAAARRRRHDEPAAAMS